MKLKRISLLLNFALFIGGDFSNRASFMRCCKFNLSSTLAMILVIRPVNASLSATFYENRFIDHAFWRCWLAFLNANYFSWPPGLITVAWLLPEAFIHFMSSRVRDYVEGFYLVFGFCPYFVAAFWNETYMFLFGSIYKWVNIHFKVLSWKYWLFCQNIYFHCKNGNLFKDVIVRIEFWKETRSVKFSSKFCVLTTVTNFCEVESSMFVQNWSS